MTRKSVIDFHIDNIAHEVARARAIHRHRRAPAAPVSIDTATAQMIDLHLGETSDLDHPYTVGLCKLLDHATERLALIDPQATAAYLRGLAHMIETGDTTEAMLAAAETLHLHMIAAIRSAEGSA